MYPPSQPPGLNLIPVHRLVDRVSNDHVSSIDPNEVNVLSQQGTHNYDGPVFQLLGNPLPGALPLHRFVSADGRHFLDAQNPSTVDPSARFEGTLGFVMSQAAAGLVPLYLWVHPQNGLFFYTTHPQGEAAGQLGYISRGAAVFVVPAG
jgi:hypothetical protein